MKRGFTLIEMLVASLLLGMLVTILTMVFNSSAIAWRTGKAGVAKMSKVRRMAAMAQRQADNLLPRIDENTPNTTGEVMSPWRKGGGLRPRALRQFSAQVFTLPPWGSAAWESSGAPSASVLPWAPVNNLGNLDFQSGASFVVGVWSYGPDGQPNTGDDITTWPEDVE